MRDDVTDNARRLADLSAVLETLPPASVPPLVQGRAAIKLADLAGDLEELAELLGVHADPQPRPAAG